MASRPGPEGGIRQRVRAALTEDILRVGREHLARDGAAALSLRAIARDLDLAPSALYRYYPGREALLTALITDSYSSLAETVEAADPGSGSAPAARWLVLCHAVREWALDRPHEWSLLFGSPVPGYHAPVDTVAYYARITGALCGPVRDAHTAGSLELPDLLGRPSPAVRTSMKAVTDALLPGLPAAATIALLVAWEQLIGSVSLEVFGHWRNTLEPPDLVFTHTAKVTARLAGLS